VVEVDKTANWRWTRN